MSGILRLESLTKGNTLKQGDKTPLKYRLFDADGEKLNVAGKSARVRLVYPDFLTIGYEKDGLTVAQDDTVTFTIDNVIPSRIYHVEIIVDDQFIFPSRADESKFTVDRSSLGTETNIVEIVGVDAMVRKAVDLINEDPNLIIDEDKLVGDIISNTGIGNINEYYKAFDDLKPKAEKSISESAEALTKSQIALSVANGVDAKATNAFDLSKSADTLSKSVQEQFNQVVINGDSSIEAAQARVGVDGEVNETLKARLDKEHTEVATQLEQNTYFGIENQTDFVDVVRKINAKPSKLFARITDDRYFEVCIPFKGSKVQHWYVDKDPNDDFMKLSGGFVSNSTLSNSVIAVEGYDSTTGTWSLGSTNQFTTEVGATFSKTFTGNGFIFRHIGDNRGGIWRFVVDGKAEYTKDYSTYGTSGSTTRSLIFENLPNGTHTVVATFMGDDPNNPPSSGEGTSRGWVYAPPGSLEILESKQSFDQEIEVFKKTSNKEFALSVTPTGATTSQWIPEHNGVGTAFAITQEVYFDDEKVTDWSAQTDYNQYESVRMVQKMYGKHPDDADNLVEFTTIHTFGPDGVFVKSKINALKDFRINNGYSLMGPVNFEFTDKMVSGFGNSYDLLSTTQYDSTDLVADNGKSLSFLFIGNDSYPDYVGAVTIEQPKKTLRVGKQNVGTPLAWLQFRPLHGLTKLYLNVFSQYQVAAGDTFEFSGSFTIGEIPMADELYG